jgi:hypothetical protein
VAEKREITTKKEYNKRACDGERKKKKDHCMGKREIGRQRVKEGLRVERGSERKKGSEGVRETVRDCRGCG